MTSSPLEGSQTLLSQGMPREANDVTGAVTKLLQLALAQQVSDLHLLPQANGLELSWRRDGVMQVIGVWPLALAANVVSRLKVLAGLLTYRTDLPQEGRLSTGGIVTDNAAVEMRLSTFPTLHGEKAVIRLFVGSGEYRQLDDLGLPAETLQDLRRQLRDTSGCLVLAGPAGSGKTTTAYACLREILQSQQRGKAIVTLEDPIEAELPGVSQTQVHRPVDFTYGLGLRSLMRQDPDVIFVGEIRDAETAETAFQASLTGHLVVTTLHAGGVAQAVVRLHDLGVEPFLLRAGLRGILCQRLLRRCCVCRQAEASSSEPLTDSPSTKPRGCELCWESGYRGRVMISEFLSRELLVLATRDLNEISETALQRLTLTAGLRTLADSAAAAIAAGTTDAAEVLRVLGHLPAAT